MVREPHPGLCLLQRNPSGSHSGLESKIWWPRGTSASWGRTAQPLGRHWGSSDGLKAWNCPGNNQDMGQGSQGMGSALCRALRSSVLPMGNPDRGEGFSFPTSTGGESQGCFAWLQVVDDCTQSQISYLLPPQKKVILVHLKAVIFLGRAGQQGSSPLNVNSVPSCLHGAGPRLLQLLQL